MRYGTKHKEWIGYLSRQQFDNYQEHYRLREWCRKQMIKHEKAILSLENVGRRKRAAVKEAAE